MMLDNISLYQWKDIHIIEGTYLTITYLLDIQNGTLALTHCGICVYIHSSTTFPFLFYYYTTFQSFVKFVTQQAAGNQTLRD